jgi:hypothetical protein
VFPDLLDILVGTSELLRKRDAAIARKQREKVFDWHQAARLIADKRPCHAIAGLSGDMSCTSGTIYRDGQPVTDTYCYLCSVWATPVLVLDDGEEIPCWIYQDESPGWDSGTIWPQSALDILREQTSPNT